MTCNEALELLSAALDGELSTIERNTLDTHLTECSHCAALFDELAGQSRLLRELECEVPAGLSARILSDLPEQAPAKKDKVIRWQRWGALAACLALVIWAGSALPERDQTAEMQLETVDFVQPEAETVESAILDKAQEPAAFSLPSAEAVQTAPAENADAKTKSADTAQYLRLQWSEDLAAPAAQLLTSPEALADCLAGCPLADGSTVPTERYDQAYFDTSVLIAVTLTEGSGSISHELECILSTDTGYEIVICRQVPEVGTCDMAAWLILVETESSITTQDELTVVLKDQKP